MRCAKQGLNWLTHPNNPNGLVCLWFLINEITIQNNQQWHFGISLRSIEISFLGSELQIKFITVLICSRMNQEKKWKFLFLVSFLSTDFTGLKVSKYLRMTFELWLHFPHMGILRVQYRVCFMQCWGLNLELCACKGSPLLRTPSLSPYSCFPIIILNMSSIGDCF